MSNIPGQSIHAGLKKKILWVLLALLLSIVALAAFLIIQAIQNANKKDVKAMAFESGHFLNENNLPELSQDGLKCSITEAYYTEDGDLMLKLKFSNGTDNAEHLNTLDITLKNENQNTIAVAGTDEIDPNFIIQAGGYTDMVFYIPPEYIVIKDDNLDKLIYEIHAT